MTIYSYKALAPGTTPGAAPGTAPPGSTSGVSGTITADTPCQARQLLREQGLAIYELVASRRSRGRKLLGWSTAKRHRAKTVEFVRELSTLLAVGTPMVTALDTIIKQQTPAPGRGRSLFTLGFKSNVRGNYFRGDRFRGSHFRGDSFRVVLVSLREQVAAGATLSDAMRQEPEVFDDLSVNLVEMGEQAGTLDTVLDRLAAFKERSRQLRGKVGGALIYPSIVLVMAVLVTLLLMTFVVPNILKPLAQAGRPLPWITLAVKALSDFLIGYWWLLLGLALLTIVGAAAVLRTRLGRLIWHRWQLSVPLVGTLVRKQAVVRIALIISTMMRSGLVFLKALEVARRSANNLVIQQALDDCKDAVHGGRDIAEALDDSGVFPPTVVQVFALGQQSGRLEDMLDRLAEGYDKQVTAAAQRLTAVLEPVMILILALLVGLIAFATVLPILEAGHVL